MSPEFLWSESYGVTFSEAFTARFQRSRIFEVWFSKPFGVRLEDGDIFVMRYIVQTSDIKCRIIALWFVL